jgi:hypothetical protein
VAAVVNVLLRYAQERYRQSRLYAGESPAIVVATDVHPVATARDGEPPAA